MSERRVVRYRTGPKARTWRLPPTSRVRLEAPPTRTLLFEAAVSALAVSASAGGDDAGAHLTRIRAQAQAWLAAQPEPLHGLLGVRLTGEAARVAVQIRAGAAWVLGRPTTAEEEAALATALEAIARALRARSGA